MDRFDNDINLRFLWFIIIMLVVSQFKLIHTVKKVATVAVSSYATSTELRDNMENPGLAESKSNDPKGI